MSDYALVKRLTDLDYSGLSPDVTAQCGVPPPPSDHFATGISPSPVLDIESDRTYGLASRNVVGTTLERDLLAGASVALGELLSQYPALRVQHNSRIG